MAKSKAHSYSSLKAFETCPRQYHEVRVLKKYPFVETEEQRYGDRLHKAAELYVLRSTPLEPEFEFIRPVLDTLKAKAGAKHPEQELCVTPKLHPTGWWDADGYLRGKVDLAILQPERKHAFVVDYKTGKDKYIDTDQLDICALLLFQHYEWLDVVSSGLLFVGANTFHRQGQYEGIKTFLFDTWFYVFPVALFLLIVSALSISKKVELIFSINKRRH